MNNYKYPFDKLFLIILILGITASSSVFGQVEFTPLTSNTKLQTKEKKHVTPFRMAPLSLPFFDDFSANGPYPNPVLWVENDVFVNQTLGANPVSLGVATFDGLSASGNPYDGGYGTSDQLTSQEINTGIAANDLYLTFYLQRGGLALTPERQDSLILRFKNQNNTWIKIAQWDRSEFNSTDSFQFYSIKIDPQFQYGNFQFRFYNYSDNEGTADNWNLDYVKLGREFTANHQRETDIAFTKPPKDILARYSAMPWWQLIGFSDDEIANEISIELFNHFDSKLQADSSFFSVKFQGSGQPVINGETLLEVPPIVSENQRDLDPGLHAFTNEIKTSGYKAAIESELNFIPEFTLETNYIFAQAQESDFGTRQNNRARSITPLRDYYAYDDGSAEVGIQFNRGPGSPTALAVQFHANYSDTLTDIRVMFPRIANEDEDQRFTLSVWGPDLNTDPIFTSKVLAPTFITENMMIDSIQGIATLRIADIAADSGVVAVEILEGDFYVGWQQISSSQRGVAVGFDRNSPEASAYNYYFNGGSWGLLTDVSTNATGAVIIQPVLKNPYDPPVSVRPTGSDIIHEYLLYPNPSTDVLFVKDLSGNQSYDYQIIDINGRVIVQSVTNSNQINIESLRAGRYILMMNQDGRTLFTAWFAKID